MKLFLFKFVYFDIQNPDQIFISVGRDRKTRIIQKNPDYWEKIQ